MNDIRYWAWGLLISTVMSAIIFLLLDWSFGTDHKTTGVVRDLIYKPESLYMSTRVEMDAQGNARTVPELHRDPASWIVMVDVEQVGIYGIGTLPRFFYNKEIGQRIPVVVRYGKWTHRPYKPSIME